MMATKNANRLCPLVQRHHSKIDDVKKYLCLLFEKSEQDEANQDWQRYREDNGYPRLQNPRKRRESDEPDRRKESRFS